MPGDNSWGNNKRFVIFSGFWPSSPAGRIPDIFPGDFIACADSGYLVCDSMGLKADIVIGDFDSLAPEQVSKIDELGIKRVIHPKEKDDTDTMLCAKYGLSRGFENYLIVGGIGGDFGHTAANLQVLSFLVEMGAKAEIVAGNELLLMVGGGNKEGRGDTPSVPDAGGEEASKLVFKGRPGARFSVLSYSERSTGVYIENARYLLTDAELTYSNPVGVSNEFINTEPVTVSVRSGRLLVIIDR